MKKLMLVRHAKSDWNDPTQDDFDRPLNERGLAAAPHMAARLLQQSIIPQRIISSPALRAKTTALAFSLKLNLPEISYNEAIYDARYADLLRVINKLPDDDDFVALVGHNPGMSDLLYELTHDMADMPTCAVAVIEFNTDHWELAGEGMGRVKFYDFPKNGD